MKFTRLFDILEYNYNNVPQKNSLASKNPKNNTWEYISNKEVWELSLSLAAGLLAAGIKKGDKISIVSYKNRWEWAIVDFATQLVGIISVPLYPTISSREYEYILNQAEVKAVFCGSGDLKQKLKSAQENCSCLTTIYSFDDENSETYWKNLLVDDWKHIISLSKQIKSEDLFTIIYTSGTTGNPKGVMLTHQNLCHIVNVVSPIVPIEREDKVLSFLPLCHVYERAVYHVLLFKGACIHLTGTDSLGGPEGDIATIKPVFFSTVPRLLEKVYEKICIKGNELTGIKKKLFLWSLKLAETYEPNKKMGLVEKVKWSIADKLIYSKWREALGGNIRMIFTGAAACPTKLLRSFCGAKIPIREGYGLTECSPTITVSSLDKDGFMLGSVGFVIDGLEVLIDKTEGNFIIDEGEILVKGPSVMTGYYKNDAANEKTFKTINDIRYLRTGDIGKIKKQANKDFLIITDRKKELLKTSGGKYVAPTPIESALKENLFIENAMVIGNNRKFVSAIISISSEILLNWSKKQNLSFRDAHELAQSPIIKQHFKQIINKVNKGFSHIEQIKEFVLVADEWNNNKPNGEETELTPTMKLKRRIILKKYAAQIESIYK